MTKVLLIVHDVYQDDNTFPLAEAYLASSLRKEGHKVDILCMDVYHHTDKQLIDILRKGEYDLIGIGFMAARYKETILPLCKLINKWKGKGKLILGGHGPSAVPEYILSNTGADAVIVGEAEKVISNAYEEILNGSNIIYGSKYKKIDNIPTPAWDLFPMEKYLNCKKYPGQNPSQKSLSMITSRGCVNECTFCYRMEKGLRLRSVERVVDEIEHLYNKFGVTYLEFADECFLLNKKRLENFTSSLENRNLKINYHCAARVKGIDEEILTLLKNSGCKFINYGFESMSQKVLKEINKNVTIDDNRKAAVLTKKIGIPFGVNFIWGYPSDDEETLRRNIKFILKFNSPEQCRTIRPVTPYPGCELYYDAIKNGLLEGPEDFFNRFKNSDLITVNFTDMDENYMYSKLFDANAELIADYAIKSNIDFVSACHMINSFHRLYFDKDYEFRGARHYSKK